MIEVDRGSLPFTLIHGEALVACASWALDEARVTQVDIATEWSVVADADDPFVLHDALCPMTPPAFIADCVARALDEDCVVVGVRPVTDTVKEVADGQVGATVDREGLVALAAPVVLPPRVVRSLDAAPGPDLAALVISLADVALVEAPPSGRAVRSEEDVRLLEALTDPRR